MADGVPWASVFDPVANARALEQIQRRGLQAAGELVDRLVSVVDGARDGGGATNGDGMSPREGESPGFDLLGVWAGLVTQTLQTMARLSVADAPSTEQPTGGPVWVDVVTGRGSGSFELAVDGDDAARASGEIWLHNASARAVGPLRLHVGELRSSEGATVRGRSVRFDPETVASCRRVPVAACGSRCVHPAGCRRVITGASSSPRAPPASRCRSRSRFRTRGDRAGRPSSGGGRAAGRRAARPPRDPRPHPGWGAAPLALPARARVSEPAGQGDPTGPLPRDVPGVRRYRRRQLPGRRRDRDAPQRVPRP